MPPYNSSLVPQVDNPSRTYPRALAISLLLMTAAYVIPLGVAAGADGSQWPCWRDGALAHVARSVGGPFLGGWVLLSALVSNWGASIQSA